MQIFVVVLVVVFVVSCNWFFPANHKSVSDLFLFTCILYCIAFLLLREAFLRMRIPSNYRSDLVIPGTKSSLYVEEIFDFSDILYGTVCMYVCCNA